MNRVLLGLQHIGEQQKHIFLLALTLAEKFDAELCLTTSLKEFHFVIDIQYKGEDQILLRSNADLKLDQLTEDLVRFVESEDHLSLKDVNIILDISNGNLRNKIVEAEEKNNFDLVILDQATPYNLVNVVMGSSALNIAADLTTPTLIVPDKAQTNLPKSIAVILESEMDTRILTLLQLMDVFGAKGHLVFLHNDNSIPNINPVLRHELKKRHFSIQELIVQEKSDFNRRLHNLMERLNADWISFIGFETQPLLRMWNINLTELVLTTNYPLVVL